MEILTTMMKKRKKKHGGKWDEKGMS